MLILMAVLLLLLLLLLLMAILLLSDLLKLALQGALQPLVRGPAGLHLPEPDARKYGEADRLQRQPRTSAVRRAAIAPSRPRFPTFGRDAHLL